MLVWEGKTNKPTQSSHPHTIHIIQPNKQLILSKTIPQSNIIIPKRNLKTNRAESRFKRFLCVTCATGVKDSPQSRVMRSVAPLPTLCGVFAQQGLCRSPLCVIRECATPSPPPRGTKCARNYPARPTTTTTTNPNTFIL